MSWETLRIPWPLRTLALSGLTPHILRIYEGAWQPSCPSLLNTLFCIAAYTPHSFGPFSIHESRNSRCASLLEETYQYSRKSAYLDLQSKGFYQAIMKTQTLLVLLSGCCAGVLAATASEYGQCGGKEWTGATTCATGSTCYCQSPCEYPFHPSFARITSGLGQRI